MTINFNDYLSIIYPKNKFTNIYKREIEKIYYNRYIVKTYYKKNKIIKCFEEETVYNEQQIKELIQTYLNEFGIEKSIYYK